MRRLLLRLRRGEKVEKYMYIGKSSESLSEKIIEKIKTVAYIFSTHSRREATAAAT